MSSSGGAGYPGTRGLAGDDAVPGAAFEQLQRRYEALRDDYDSLLERLAAGEAQGGPVQSPTPGRLQGQPGNIRAEVRRVVAAPWYQLQQEYAATIRDLERLVADMDAFAARSFGALKGQRGPGTTSAAGPDPESRPGARNREEPEPIARDEVATRSPRPTPVQVQVHSPNLGALLDFQERLTQLDEVARVSMSQVNEDRAVLVVELEPGAPGAD